MKKDGFTLFELLVSISIVGILTAMAIVSFSSAQKKARDARRMQDMGSIAKAAEQYYSMSNYSYPSSSLFVAGVGWSATNGQKVLEAYPQDPKGIGYTTPSVTASSFCVCAYMEGQKGNSTNTSCNYGAGSTGWWYCASNQQ